MTQRVRTVTLFTTLVLFHFPLAHLLFSPVQALMERDRAWWRWHSA
jgi:hypothetical protein